MAYRIFHRIFMGILLIAGFTYISTQLSFAQSAPPTDIEICPFGNILSMNIDQGRDSRSGDAYATLLWLDRGDAMWSDHPNDSDSLKGKSLWVIRMYQRGESGYPKSKKIAKRLRKYKDAHRDARPAIINGSGAILPRPKGIPATPPASAVSDAESKLNCRYDANAARKMTQAFRTELIKNRQTCPIDWLWAVKQGLILGANPDWNELWLKAQQNQAIAILDWKHRGSDAFHTPSEDGRQTYLKTRNDIKNLFRSGISTLLPKDPESLALLEEFDPMRPVPAALQAPSDELVYWAEDRLNCKLDSQDWQSKSGNRATARAEERRAKDEREKIFLAGAASRRAEQELRKTVRGRWRRPATENLPANKVQIGVYFDEAICANVQRHMEGRETLNADEQAWGNWYAFYGHDELCGFLPPTYAQWLPNRSSDTVDAGGTNPSASPSTDLSQYDTPPETKRERSNRERYEENQRCSNPTATGC
ncbi:MAG: hypothetical protein ABJO36_11120 [Litorimonas sp.]